MKVSAFKVTNTKHKQIYIYTNPEAPDNYTGKFTVEEAKKLKQNLSKAIEYVEGTRDRKDFCF